MRMNLVWCIVTHNLNLCKRASFEFGILFVLFNLYNSFNLFSRSVLWYQITRYMVIGVILLYFQPIKEVSAFFTFCDNSTFLWFKKVSLPSIEYFYVIICKVYKTIVIFFVKYFLTFFF